MTNAKKKPAAGFMAAAGIALLTATVTLPASTAAAAGAKMSETAQLTEHMAIQDLLSSYSMAVTKHDFAAIGPLFTENATWDTVGTPKDFHFKGAEIGPGIKSAIDMAADLVQLNTPAIIEIHGDHATARSTIHEFGDMADHSAHAAGTGVYEDKLRKVNGVWKFESRVFTMRQLWILPYPPKPAK